MIHTCNPAFHCRLCEIAGRPTPAAIPATVPQSPPVPIPLPCIHRGEPASALAIVQAGGNPARLHVRCEHPTTPLGIVDACGTCGAGTTPKCNSACTGYAVEPPPSNIYRPVPKPSILRTRDRCVVTLAVGIEGEELHALTGPSQRAYAAKIGADYHVITGQTQSESMVCFEKFRVRPYAEAYPDGTVYLDADVFVMPDAPDVFDTFPDYSVSAVGMVDIGPRMPGVLDFGRGQLEKLSRAFGKPIPAGAAEVYWNSGVWVGYPEAAHYWTPPPMAIAEPHWCDEETWCRWNAFASSIPVHPLDKRFNWTWCEDRGLSQWDQSRPWFVHLAGMGAYAGHPVDWKMSNPTIRKLMFKVMEAMRHTVRAVPAGQ